MVELVNFVMYEIRELQLFKELHFYENQFSKIIFTDVHLRVLTKTKRLQSTSSTYVSVKFTLKLSSKVSLFLDVSEI